MSPPAGARLTGAERHRLEDTRCIVDGLGRIDVFVDGRMADKPDL